ncbi:MAG: YMGG-like glycine zipper-containing protein [Candidatus Hinthialibacter antarcticus]|nr:YMGG-like glycine zipper-containing protein [Candidatus Hinthialibacter antarcticus]
MKMMKFGVVSVLGISLLFAGCTATPAQKGAMGGGALGAVAGQLIGGDTKSTLIGAGAGALGGALLNDQVDKSKRQSYDQGYNQGYNQGAQSNQSTPPPPPNYNTAPR